MAVPDRELSHDCVVRHCTYLRRTESQQAMADIESPCNKVCVVDPLSARCISCGRTLAEIASWTTFTPEERRRIMAELATRPPPRNNRIMT